MNRTRPVRILTLALALLAAIPAANAQTPTLDQVLAKLEQANKGFHSMEASIERTHVTVLVNDRTSDWGKVYVSGTVSAPRRVKLDLVKPLAQSVLIDNGLVQLFIPSQKLVRQRPVDKDQQVAGECILLGLCQANIRESFNVTLIGEETAQGVKATVLELKPKSAKAASSFPSIRMWLDPQKWVPVQSRITEGSGDYQIVNFTNIKINQKVSDSVFNLKLPKDVQKQSF